MHKRDGGSGETKRQEREEKGRHILRRYDTHANDFGSGDCMLGASAVRILQRNQGIPALTDVECPIDRDVTKLLYLSRHRPRHLNLHDLRSVPDPDVLAKWIASEA